MELPNLKTFTLVNTYQNRFGLKMPITGAQALFYEKDINGKIISVALYKMLDKDIYMAWGDKDIQHCAYHALLFTDTPHIIEGCADFTYENNSFIFKENNELYTYSINNNHQTETN